MTVNGAGFVSGGDGSSYPATVVQWNGMFLATTYVSEYQLTALVPAIFIAAPGSATITFVDVFGNTSNALTFTILPAASSVTLSSLSPNSAHVGDPNFTMTVNGSGFLVGATVLWNGLPVPARFNSSTQLEVSVGGGLIDSPGSATVRVANPVGAASNALVFTIYAVPTQVFVSPNSLTFTFKAGGLAPAAQTVAISSDSPGAINAFVDPIDNPVGVTVVQNGDNTPATLIVSVNPLTLDLSEEGVPFPIPPGFYVLFILISVDGVGPVYIPVYLNILDAFGIGGYPIAGAWQLTAGEGQIGVNPDSVQVTLFTAAVQVAVSGTPTVEYILPPINNSQGSLGGYQVVDNVSGQFTFTFSQDALSPTGNPCMTTANFEGTFIVASWGFSSNGSPTIPAYPSLLSIDLFENGRNMNFFGSSSGVLADQPAGEVWPFNGTYNTVSGGYGCTEGQEYPQGNWFAKRLPTPTITPTPDTLKFAYQIGGVVPPAQTLSLTSSSPVSFSVTTFGGSWLSVTPSQGTTPAGLVASVNPAGLTPGTNIGSITVSAPGAIGSPYTIPVALTISDSVVNITSVGNGASFGQSFAPGMLMSVFGTGLSSGSPQAVATAPLPVVSASGTSVAINGVAAPLLYISPTQINLQIPYELPEGNAALKVSADGENASTNFTIQAAAPGIFVDSQNGHIVPNESAAAGSTIELFLTGAGLVTPSEVDGNVPADGATPSPNLPLTMTVGGVPVTPVYVGIPAWSIGVLQINFTVPSTLAAGPQPVVVTIGGIPSPMALLTVIPTQ
jgi:uncharacterized protein (TIGR03437 family)